MIHLRSCFTFNAEAVSYSLPHEKIIRYVPKESEAKKRKGRVENTDVHTR